MYDQYLAGIHIVGNSGTILNNVEKYKIDTIIFAIPSCPLKRRTEILNICGLTKCDLKILPSLYKLENVNEFVPTIRKVEIEDLLDENGYCRSLTLENTGTKNMPYTIAYHTTFVAPDKFAVALNKFCELGEGYIPTGRKLDLSPEQQTYRDGLILEGKKINGLYTSGGNVARIGDFKMVVSEQFDHWIIFNGNGDEGYLCIEPQCGSTNGLNSGEHAVLAPGCQETFVIRIEKW
jgi:aldose 1-epimerase